MSKKIKKILDNQNEFYEGIKGAMLDTIDTLKEGKKLTRHTVEIAPPKQIFQLSCDYYDEHRHWLLYHKNKTEKEFKKDCIRAAREVGNKYIDNERGYAEVSDWMDLSIEKLLEYGYEEINILHFEHNDYGMIDKDSKDWKKVVGKELFDKANDKNTKIRDKCYKRIREDMKE